MSETGQIEITYNNGIATLEFFHPASNSLPSNLLEKFTRNLYSLSEDKQVKVIVLKSKGEKTFCAGASFDELLSIENVNQGVAFFSGFGKLVNAMRKCKKPIIGQIQGKAVGGGVGIISACDYAMATKLASVKLSEISIGIGPFVVEPAITRKIGVAATSELAFNPTEWQDAHWAKEKGLYAKVFDTLNDLELATAKLAEQLNTFSEEATQKLKNILWEGTDHWDELMEKRAHICGNLVLNQTTKNALKQFKNKG